MSNTPKTCGCGLTHSPEAWSLLPFVGVMRDDEEASELRNCGCGSTLSVPLCIVEGCTLRGSWKREDSLGDYCEGHINEWLMAEDRADFGDECAREARRERDLEAAQ
jgi:hypothetical protein